MKEQFLLRGFPVFSGDKSLEALYEWIATEKDIQKLFILTDENTSRFCLPVLSQILSGTVEIFEIKIPSGESHKNMDSCIQLWKKLTGFHVGRKDVLMNLGGGVITDIGGFVASTYKRGLRFINVPTTLLGMVDASIGGKTGVDLDHIKNLVGTFCFPSAVFIAPVFLNTLDNRQLKNGLAEIYKHGLIADAKLWNMLPDTVENMDQVIDLIDRAISVKVNIVESDPLEKGKRKILNFGHTIGHGIESIFLQKKSDSILHGEAVAAGMIMETWLSEKYAGLSSEAADKIIQKLITVFGKLDVSSVEWDLLLSMMMHDKKNSGGEFNFSLLKDIGEAGWDYKVKTDDIQMVFEKYKTSIE